MESRSGRIEKGAVVLSEPTDAPDGTDVTVLIGKAAPVRVSPEELRVIDSGLREAESPARIDARAFLRELRSAR